MGTIGDETKIYKLTKPKVYIHSNTLYEEIHRPNMMNHITGGPSKHKNVYRRKSRKISDLL